MPFRMPKPTMILAAAMQTLLEKARTYQSQAAEPGIACVRDEGTKDRSGRLRARTGMLVGVGVCLLGATPASAAAGTGIGSGRLVPTVAAVVGLFSVVLGGLTLARSARRTGIGNGRRGAIAAGAGLVSVVVGGLHSANAAGGFGTGNGLAGAIVAMVVGLIGLLLGGLVLARGRRNPGQLIN